MTKDRRRRAGTEFGETDGELTLIGEESWRDLSTRRVVWEREKQRHRMQNRAVLGLLLLLGVILPLGTVAMVGVGAGWFEPSFAMQVLAITLTPSFTAWLLVVRWAFRQEGRVTRSRASPRGS